MRIASLLASGTELVCALGAGDELVGRSHECDHPLWVKRLPVLSRPTFDVTGTSAEIDAHVRAALRAGEPLYEVDEAALAALAPDVVITQTHCEVCAVSPEGGAWQRRHAVALRTGTVAGIFEGFAEVAAAIGRTEAGARLVAECRARLAAWRAATAPLPRKRLICLEWIEPPFALGNWGPELVAAAGGEDALGVDGGHSAAIAWETVRAADPDVLVVAPCGFGLERTAAEMALVEERFDGFRQIFLADGNLYFNRSGPSVIETVDILAELLHPAVFPPRHEGTAWRRWR